MMILKFRNKEEHSDIMKKVKKMKKFAEELEECLEDVMDDDDFDFRGGSYRKSWDDEDMEMKGRYGYRRSMR